MLARLLEIVGLLTALVLIVKTLGDIAMSWRASRQRRRSMTILVLVLIVPAVASAELWSGIVDTDKAVRWQDRVGIPGGIPTRTTQCGATLTPNGTDDTSQINTAIGACGTNEVVVLGSGTFKLGSQLNITRSNFVLRGQGSGVTIIKVLPTFSGGFYTNGVIVLDNGSSFNNEVPPDGNAPAAVAISSGYTQGSTQIVMSAAHGLSVDDIILIDQRNSESSDPPATCVGSEGCAAGAQGRFEETAHTASHFRSQGQLNKVTNVVNGTTVDLDMPLFQTYESGRIPQMVRIIGMVRNVGIEHLTLLNLLDSTTTSVNDTSFSFNGTVNCWTLDFEVHHGDPVASTGWGSFHLSTSYRDEIRQSKFWGDRKAGSDSYGIIMQPWVTGLLVENSILKDRPFVFGGPTSGNVFAYNYYKSPPWPVLGASNYNYGATFLHGANPQFNLFEGNYFEGYNTNDAGSHGNSTRNTWLRNRLLMQNNGSSQGNWLFDLEFYSYYHNIVGNVLGANGWETLYSDSCDAPGGGGGTANTKLIFRFGYTDFSGGCNNNGNSPAGAPDPLVDDKTLIHANYDYVNDAVTWSGAITHTIPNSFYRATQPDFFGACAWPVYGPENNPTINTLPAKDRDDGTVICTGSSTTNISGKGRGKHLKHFIELAPVVLGMGWHFRRALLTLCLSLGTMASVSYHKAHAIFPEAVQRTTYTSKVLAAKALLAVLPKERR